VVLFGVFSFRFEGFVFSFLGLGFLLVHACIIPICVLSHLLETESSPLLSEKMQQKQLKAQNCVLKFFSDPLGPTEGFAQMAGNYNATLDAMSKHMLAIDWHKIWADFSTGMLRPLLALAVVVGAIVVSYSQHLGIEQEMAISITRAFIQLSIIGFVLEFIFNQSNVVWIFMAYIFMVTVAGSTAGRRAKHVPRGAYVAGASIFVGTSLTMALLVVLKVFPFTPRYIIPVAGMMVGNLNYPMVKEDATS